PSTSDLLAMMAATTEDLGNLGLIFGADTRDVLNWHGTYDSAGWTWNASGIYQGNALNLSYVGTYNSSRDIELNISCYFLDGDRKPRHEYYNGQWVSDNNG